jgi:hypothetical protein
MLYRVYAARLTGRLAGRDAITTLVLGLLVAGVLGWLVVEQTGLGVVLAALACAVPLVLASGLSLRGMFIAVALLGHLVSGPLYVQGYVHESGWLTLLLDVLVVLAFLSLLFQPQSRPRPWRAAVLALAVLVVLQAFNPLLPSIGYGLTGARPIAVPLLLIVAVASGHLNRRDERVLIAVALIGWLVNVFFAGRQLLVGFTGAELHWVESTRATYLVGEQVRLLGATRSNQDFAFMVAVAFPAVCAAALAPGRSLRWRVGFGLLTFATFGVLVGSLVRSGLVGGVLGAVVVAAAVTHGRHARRRLVVSAAVLVAVVWLVATFGLDVGLSKNQSETLTSRVTSVFTPNQDYSFQQRQTKVWPHVIHEIGIYPLGAGAGSAGPLTQSQEDAPLGQLVPDNGYLLMAIEFGLPGLALFIVVLGLLIAELWRGARKGEVMAAAGMGAVVALCGAMVTGNFVSLVSPSCVWAIIVGLGLRAAASQRFAAPARIESLEPLAALA